MSQSHSHPPTLAYSSTQQGLIMRLSLVSMIFCGAKALAAELPLCLQEPVISIEAGVSNISAVLVISGTLLLNATNTARVDTPLNGLCEATMLFSEPTFLPIRFLFKSIPCDGQQINTFTVPKGVPNGIVEVTWYEITGISSPECWCSNLDKAMRRYSGNL